MTTRRLLRNARRRAMITPVRPLPQCSHFFGIFFTGLELLTFFSNFQKSLKIGKMNHFSVIH